MIALSARFGGGELQPSAPRYHFWPELAETWPLTVKTTDSKRPIDCRSTARDAGAEGNRLLIGRASRTGNVVAFGLDRHDETVADSTRNPIANRC
jgi:hypothetical protein